MVQNRVIKRQSVQTITWDGSNEAELREFLGEWFLDTHEDIAYVRAVSGAVATIPPSTLILRLESGEPLIFQAASRWEHLILE
jgi:hypothetical protein